MLKNIKQAISSVFIGKEEAVDAMLVCLLANGHILLEDVPGTGKTLLAKTVAKVIDGAFSRIQFTPDVLPGDITGIEYFNAKTGEFELRQGPIHTNLLLADEINRAMPRSQSSLLEAMEERQVTIERHTLPLPKPFLVIATQNPLESQGTFPLPDAQLDRFLMLIPLGYPTMEEERDMLRRFRVQQPLEQLGAAVSLADIVAMQEQVKEVTVAEAVEDYILHLVQRTRSHHYLAAGISPRGTLALMRSVQAYAFLKGRAYVTPDDVQRMVPYVWAHRLMLSMEGALRVSKSELLRDILEEVDVPVELQR
ncbi:AAA family ATPase [Ectobacillus ponti]|uniref:MoxR family ATPase n=1 Tax=Ectobacillus ponti TaxID=2961894 RepID=A0AA41X984_9BACI|nr:MoxR family ATPase [Ectobacillus ponti]MCP8968633.1 MoxR family ATPase [Ectobacillus ponti]